MVDVVASVDRSSLLTVCTQPHHADRTPANRPYRAHGVDETAWSVWRLVGQWSRLRALQKRPNRSRCRLGCGLVLGPGENVLNRGQIPQGRGIWGKHVETHRPLKNEDILWGTRTKLPQTPTKHHLIGRVARMTLMRPIAADRMAWLVSLCVFVCWSTMTTVSPAKLANRSKYNTIQ